MKNCENYIIAIEEKYVSRAALVGLLQDSHEAYVYLLEREYIKPGKGNEFAFSFVGVISFKDKVICVLPKYYQEVTYSCDRQISEFATVIKVLKKIGRINEIPDSNNLSSNEYVNLTEVVLADKFLRDYLDYGIYNKTSNTLVLNGGGETNWDNSINRLNPVFTKRRPIYSEVYTSSTITEQYNIVTELHKWVVKYCLQRFGRILDYKFSYLEDCVSDVLDLGSIEYIKTSIRRELNVTYTDREILLLKRLLAFLDKVRDDNTESFNLYGTGYFHVIWEKVCGSFLNNRIDDFPNQMPSPKWNDRTGKSVSKSTLKPDVISTMEGEASKLFIFDAKYYNLHYSSEGDLKVSDNPGVEDVSKQFLYAEAFKNVSYAKKYNCFLFPKIGPDFFYVVGSVTFAIFNETVIHNIFLSPDMLFQAYLHNSPVSTSLLKGIADALES